MCLPGCLRQGVEEGRTGCGEGGARSFARRSRFGIARLLSRPLGRPSAVTQRLGPLALIREGLRSVDRRSCAPIVLAFAFEDRQRRPRARQRVVDDRFGIPNATSPAWSGARQGPRRRAGASLQRACPASRHVSGTTASRCWAGSARASSRPASTTASGRTTTSRARRCGPAPSASRPGHSCGRSCAATGDPDTGLAGRRGSPPASPQPVQPKATARRDALVAACQRALRGSADSSSSRSVSDSPPHTPYRSWEASACSRHVARTGHCAQIRFATASRPARTAPRSSDGWKNNSESKERQAPRSCHSHLSI